MYTSSSEGKLHAVIIHSTAPADVAKGDSLRNELKRQDTSLDVTAAHTESDLDAALRNCRHRCIAYLSPDLLNDPGERTLLDFAADRGRDAIVVVLDDALEPLPGEWADFTCFHYTNEHIDALCRELALLIRTPLLERRPQDITGYAAAVRVFYGYLKFVLTNFHTRLRELPPDVYASCVKKYLFICPESCCCPPSMEIPGSIKCTDYYVMRNMTRAGERNRDYSVRLYGIIDEERNNKYYFPAVFAESLASLDDIKKSGLAGIDDHRMHIERNQYILHLQQLLQHSKDAVDYSFMDQCRILYWRDEKVKLDKYLLPIIREEMENETVQVPEKPINFQCVDGHGVNPGSLYTNPTECYKLDSKRKGVCLIINIEKFQSSTETEHSTLPQRTGSEADVLKLKDLFQWLKFDVQCHSNVNKASFLSIVKKAQELDHSTYDAFVCCIMSHGFLGHIFTADCQHVRILEDIAYSFYPESCQTLTGKPKIFFIQSCQISVTHGSVTLQGTMKDYETSALENIASTVESDADVEQCDVPERNKRTFLLPHAPDFFMSYSTLPISESYRMKEGTWYMQALTEVLKKGCELKDSLDEVGQLVQQKATENNEQQRPFYYVSSDHKRVYLHGKLVHRC